MTFKVTLNNGKSYSCQEDQTVFEGARSNGIFLDHSCLTARCSSCKVKVTQGETQSLFNDNVLTDKERADGFILSCNCKPTSDLSIDAEDLTEYNLQKPKTVPAKISSLKKITDSVIRLSLRTPPRQKIQFLEGQYVDIIKGSVRRSYSIACQANDQGTLDFLIKNYPGGIMSAYIFDEAKEADLLRIEGPKGTFFKRQSDYKTLVFLATGTGIAPVKAMLENMVSNQATHNDLQVYVFWGARTKEELYEVPVLENNSINYFSVLSRPLNDWEGNRGYVQDVALKILGNFTDSEVYACGSDAMIQSARQLTIENGLEKSAFYADAFVPTN
jgi:CDP-4-dehydro-6-deoxyglucose reductase